MVATEFEREVSELLDQRPFRMFALELNDGERLEIDNPIAFSYRGGTAHFFKPGGKPVWFRYDDVNHIYPDVKATPMGTLTQS